MTKRADGSPLAAAVATTIASASSPATAILACAHHRSNRSYGSGSAPFASKLSEGSGAGRSADPTGHATRRSGPNRAGSLLVGTSPTSASARTMFPPGAGARAGAISLGMPGTLALTAAERTVRDALRRRGLRWSGERDPAPLLV